MEPEQEDFKDFKRCETANFKKKKLLPEEGEQ